VKEGLSDAWRDPLPLPESLLYKLAPAPAPSLPAPPTGAAGLIEGGAVASSAWPCKLVFFDCGVALPVSCTCETRRNKIPRPQHLATRRNTSKYLVRHVKLEGRPGKAAHRTTIGSFAVITERPIGATVEGLGKRRFDLAHGGSKVEAALSFLPLVLLGQFWLKREGLGQS
jgi:hypothetical protein